MQTESVRKAIYARQRLNVYGRRLSFDKQTLVEYAPGNAHRHQGIRAALDVISEHLVKYTLTEVSSPPLYVPKFLTWAEYVGMYGWSEKAEERFGREDYAHIYQGAWHISGNFVEVSAGFSVYTRDESLACHFAELIHVNAGYDTVVAWHKSCEQRTAKRNYQAYGEAILAERERNQNARNNA